MFGRMLLLLLLERFPPICGRLFDELLLLVVGLLTTVLLVEDRFMLLPTLDCEEVLRLVTTALFCGEAVATLRLPAAAALELDAGRRPCAIAPVEVMASPQASIKPIIVL